MDKFFMGRNYKGDYKFAAKIEDLINNDEYGNNIDTIRIKELMESETSYFHLQYSRDSVAAAKDWLFFHQITNLGPNE